MSGSKRSLPFDPQDRLLQSWLETGAFDHVIVTGCGSTYYLALTAARLLRQAASCPRLPRLRTAAAFTDSICAPGQRYLLLTISRSGTTSETVRAQEQFKAQVGGPVVTITCDSAVRSRQRVRPRFRH